MKTRRVLFLLPLLLVPGALLAQSPDTTAGRQQRNPRQTVFRDENGNGIDDRLERRIAAAARKKDRFVDTDGDGICDGRAGGLGFRRGAGGTAAGTGGTQAGKESGKGSRFGQGGKR